MPSQYINKRVLYQPRRVESAAGLLLDSASFQNAHAAYSIRKLRTAYAGSCMKVRRSTDNTTLDIGFLNDALDTVALLTFVGIGKSFVDTWYDQSGNSRNITQVTQGLQPQISDTGSVIIVDPINSKPAMLCVDPTKTLAQTISLVGTSYTLAGVCNFTSPIPTNGVEFFGGYENNYGIYLDPDNIIFAHQVYDGINFTYWITTLVDPITLDTPHSFFVFRSNLTGLNFYVDNVDQAEAILTGVTNITFPFRSPSGELPLFGIDYTFKGYMQEAILWSDNKIANSSLLQTNIDSYF